MLRISVWWTDIDTYLLIFIYPSDICNNITSYLMQIYLVQHRKRYFLHKQKCIDVHEVIPKTQFQTFVDNMASTLLITKIRVK